MGFLKVKPILNPIITIPGIIKESSTGKMYLAVGLEGTVTEVNWMAKQLSTEWRGRGTARRKTVVGQNALNLWQRLFDFPGEESPLVIKASMVPSGTTRLIRAAREVDPDCSIQAHAGNGIAIVRCSSFPSEGLSRTLVSKLQPVANQFHGNIVVLSNPGGAEMTHQCVWGGIDAPFALMSRVKEQFDPKDLLNPGRFVYVED